MGARTLRLPVITPIEFKNVKMIIMDSPSKHTVPYFLQECSRLHVSDIVRVCEDRYPIDDFEKAGIRVHHWEFSDGSPPPDHILAEWFSLLRQRFYGEQKKSTSNATSTGPVAVHCVAGYGRAPVLVAVALMELGMPYTDAIELIRSQRKGSFNDRQLDYLSKYTPKARLRRNNRRCFVM